MRTLLLLLLLFIAVPAWADESTQVAVSDGTPTLVPTTFCTTCRSILLENGGSNAIYCSTESDVTTDTGHYVAPTNGWRSFPYAKIYCIAATAAQTGTGRDHTLVWVSNQ